jgi:hypothetical protein
MSEPNKETVETVPTVPMELPEQRYEYQPLDEQGRPLGGKQVIVYRTGQELADKLRDQNVQLVRKMRELNRKLRLGVNEELAPPDVAERVEKFVELKPQHMSTDEVFNLTQDLNDPGKFESARDRLLESAIGISPSKLAEILNKSQMTTLQLAAVQNFDRFVKETPEYATGETFENRKTLTDWVVKYGLAPTVDNFKLAYNSLKEAGLLLSAPVQRQEPATPAPAATPVSVPQVANNEEPKPQVPVQEPARISEAVEPQVQRSAKIPSGLNSSRTSPSGTDILPQERALSMTLKELDALSADQYKVRYRDPKFRELVDKLEAIRAEKARIKGVAS